jgi:hypothetical protein
MTNGPDVAAMANGPVRVQLSRRKGWRMPPNTVSVARPGRYGNEYRIGVDGDAAECVAKCRQDWEEGLNAGPGLHRALYRTLLVKLRGKNLACWCALNQPCHADVLLDLANREATDD